MDVANIFLLCRATPVESFGQIGLELTRHFTRQGDLARLVTWPDEDVIVGVCRQLYDSGGSVWLDPLLSVAHP